MKKRFWNYTEKRKDQSGAIEIIYIIRNYAEYGNETTRTRARESDLS